MIRFIKIDEEKLDLTNGEKFRRFLQRTFKFELFVGLWVVLKQMLFKKSVTLKYPFEKLEISPRQRGVHKLMRLLESGNERCIGCGLCEKICVSNCIAMETKLGDDGRKKVINYSINHGRCVYCGLCADVCPEIAITHGKEYEFAAEQRAYFGMKSDLLTPIATYKNQVEFEGYGSLPKNASGFLKITPTSYLNKDEKDEVSDA